MFHNRSAKQVRVNQAAESIERQKSSHFRGRAKVPLEFLYFTEHTPRQLDQINVERLRDAFSVEGVKRLTIENHIPAVIRKDDLERAVQLSGLSLLDILNGSQDKLPLLTFPDGFRLECLHGKHRVEAAKLSTCLQGEDRWWTVTLYSADLSKQAKTSLIEDYSNSQKFSDGLVFRKLVEYETSDHYSRQHWWSWLTDCKRDILTRIFAHKEYNAALREMIRIPALLEDLNITVWHKIIATRSDEEFLHYISRIVDTFDHICGRQARLCNALDSETVAHVQSRCPGASLNDLKYLQSQMQEGRIFHAVDDASREEIWTRLSAVKYLIPTLGSLQQDFKYIRGPAKAVYDLLKSGKSRRRSRQTLRGLAKSTFLMPRRDGKITIQITDDSTQEISGHIDDQLEVAFQQLYLFAMRESWDLVDDRPLKEQAWKTPTARPADPIVWHGFAKLAWSLGFDSPEIQRLMQTNPFEEKARQVLPNKQELLCEDARLRPLLTDLAELYETKNLDRASPRHEPQMLTDETGEPIDRRRGRCYQSGYERDKRHLFFKTLSQPIGNRTNSVTSLYVRKCVYNAFFPSWEVESGARADSDPKAGTDSTLAGARNGDTDMSEAPEADLRSGERRSPHDFLDPSAISIQTAPASPLPTLRETRVAVAPTLSSSPAVAGASRKRPVQSRSTSPSLPAEPSLPSSSLALQLTSPDEERPEWARKRPRTTYNLDVVGTRSSELANASELEGGNNSQMALESSAASSTSGKSISWEDARARSSDPSEVTIWIDLEGDYKELEGITCRSSHEVEEQLRMLQAKYDCFPSTSEGRGLMPTECYSRATEPGGDNRVYVTIEL